MSRIVDERAARQLVLADFTCPIITPEAQVEIKRSLPLWNPALPRRPKDATDIALLEAALRPGSDGEAALRPGSDGEAALRPGSDGYPRATAS